MMWRRAISDTTRLFVDSVLDRGPLEKVVASVIISPCVFALSFFVVGIYEALPPVMFLMGMGQALSLSVLWCIFVLQRHATLRSETDPDHTTF